MQAGVYAWKRFAIIGWLAWTVVVFGLLNFGLQHPRLRSIQRAMAAGQTPTAGDAVRAYYTNDGDLWRYFAYVQATLGRPYPSYFVRSAEAWRAAFASREPYRPDEMPEISPPAALLPYRDFLVEYPPGFFLLALPIAAFFGHAGSFALAFQCSMALTLSLALVLATRAVALSSDNREPRSVAAWAAFAALLLGVVTTHRYDASVALVLAFGSWAFVNEQPALLGLAAAAVFVLKGVPLVAFPPLAMVWLRERRHRDLTLFVSTALIAAAAIVVPVLWLAGPASLDTARYHATRPIQIESTWGALLGFVHAARPDLVTIEKTFGSTNTTGGLALIVAPISTGATILAMLVVYFVTWRRMRNPSGAERRRAAFDGLLASLAAFMACGKVCSPQYLVWILPVGLAGSLASGRRSTLTILLLVFALTQAIYPASYGALEALRPWALSLVFARNILLLIWAGVLMRSPPEPI